MTNGSDKCLTLTILNYLQRRREIGRDIRDSFTHYAGILKYRSILIDRARFSRPARATLQRLSIRARVKASSRGRQADKSGSE